MTTSILLISGVLAGVVAGAIAVIYGIRLGNKLTITSREDIPLDDDSRTIEQEHTE